VFEFALAWGGGLLIGVALTIGLARRRWQLPVDAGKPISFVEVCEAAGRAKEERRSNGNLSRDYADGADAVMAELMEAGYCETPEEMRAAYLVGGEEVELEEADQL